jgi:hypothetical protein
MTRTTELPRNQRGEWVPRSRSPIRARINASEPVEAQSINISPRFGVKYTTRREAISYFLVRWGLWILSILVTITFWIALLTFFKTLVFWRNAGTFGRSLLCWVTRHCTFSAVTESLFPEQEIDYGYSLVVQLDSSGSAPLFLVHHPLRLANPTTWAFATIGAFAVKCAVNLVYAVIQAVTVLPIPRGPRALFERAFF